MLLRANKHEIHEAISYCAKVKQSHRVKCCINVSNPIFKCAEIVMARVIAQLDGVCAVMYENENEITSAPHEDRGDLWVYTGDGKKYTIDVKTRVGYPDLIVNKKDVRPNYIYLLVNYYPNYKYAPVGFALGKWIARPQYEWTNPRIPHIGKYLLRRNMLIPFRHLQNILPLLPHEDGNLAQNIPKIYTVIQH